MPVYIGNAPIDDILSTSDADDYDAVYLGSDLVWPPIEFPYTVLDSNIIDAEVPEGATGCWVNLHGGGEAGGRGGHSEGTTATGSASGGSRGGGAAVIDKFFIYVEDLPSNLWSLIKGVGGVAGGQDGTASRFICGTVDLTANGGAGGNGGTASASGLTADYYSIPTYNGTGASNANRAGAGGGTGGNASWTGDNAGHGLPGSDGYNTTGALVGHPAGNGGDGGNGAGGGNAQHWASGGGGGGGGGAYDGGNGTNGTTNSGGTHGVGGDGRAEVQWVNTFVPKKKAYPVITTAGAWSWTCPMWMRNGDKVDIAICGAGKGGKKGTSTSAGAGGRAGAYQGITLTVGVHVNPGGTISGVIGKGGAANGGNGGNTTCVYTGGTLTALGATGVLGSVATNGETRAPFTFNGRTYEGGAGGAYNALAAGSPGSAPGGGGGPGGSVFFAGQNGAAGGNGGVNIYAYQV